MRRVSRQHDDFLTVWLACHAAERGRPLEVVNETVHALAKVCTEHGMRIDVPDNLPNDPTGMRLALARLLDDVQRSRPIALVFDDVENADELSLNSLGQLVRRLRTGRIMIVFTIGHERVPILSPQGPSTLDAVIHHLHSAATPMVDLHLSTLGPHETLELAGELLGHEPDPRLARNLIDYARGNPALIEAMVAADLTDPGATTAPLPPPLMAVLRTRLDRLSAPARSLLDAIAVLDAPSRLPLVAQVADFEDPSEPLEELLAAGLVQWSPTDPSILVRVVDPLLAKSAYELIGPRRRRSLHSAAARLVSGEERWRHRAAAAVGVDTGLARELEVEASRLATRGDADNAIRYLRWAATLCVSTAEHERLLLVAAILAIWANRNHEVAALTPVIDFAEPSGLRNCALGLLRIRESGNSAEATVLLDANFDAAVGEAPPWVLPIIAVGLASAHLANNNGSRALTCARVALDHAADSDSSVVARAARYWLLAKLFTDGPVAADEAVDALVTALEPHLHQASAVICAERSVLNVILGRFADSIDDATRAVNADAAVVGGDARLVALLALVDAQFLRGMWNDVENLLQSILDAVNATKINCPMAFVHARFAQLAAGRGNWLVAERQIRQVETEIRSQYESGHMLQVAIAKASLAAARGEPAKIVSAFDDLGRVLGGTTLTGPALALECFWRPLLLEGLVETANLELCESELNRLTVLAHSVPHLRTQVNWLSARIAERRRAPAAARRFYEQAVADSTITESVPLHRGLAEMAFGRFLLTQGDNPSAVTWLTRAHNRFLSIGATPFAARCAAIIDSGQLDMYTAFALTDREREVATLVCAGMTNGQTASRLYVSEKTVEFHLGNIYAKLGISSRRQLRAFATASAEQRK